MSNGTAAAASVNNNVRKFLFWLRYDGSRFASMAKGADPYSGPSVFHLFEACLAQMFGREESARMITFIVSRQPSYMVNTISRTDAKVHAIRCPILVKVPDAYNWFNQTDTTRIQFVQHFNDQIQRTEYVDAMKLLHIDPVVSGFHPLYHVAYRRYVYRLRVLNSEQSQHFSKRYRTSFAPRPLIPNKPSLGDITEFNYSWTIPPTFCVERAQYACDLLKRPGQNYASFYLHRMRDRLTEPNFKSVTRRRQLSLLQISKGEPYSIAEDGAQYYNLDFVAHGFMRQQIRRMVALIVRMACDRRWTTRESKRIVDFLLKDPDPLKFRAAGLYPAPGAGLFLTDVVYDPRMFLNPYPLYTSRWDDPVEDEECDDETENGEQLSELD